VLVCEPTPKLCAFNIVMSSLTCILTLFCHIQRAALATALNAARAEAEAAAEALAATQAMLDDRPTHEQLEALRAQVAALQAVGGWDENDDAGAAGESSIEGLLVKKNRHLEHEVTTLKRQLCDSQAAADAADAKAAAATATAAEQQRLVKQLEEDLARQDTVDSGPDVWGAETEAAQATLLAMASGGDVEQGARSRESGSQSVVKVLAGQRDRFKERTLQLEEQLRCALLSSPAFCWVCRRTCSGASGRCK
jgi:homeobox protein cut-like